MLWTYLPPISLYIYSLGICSCIQYGSYIPPGEWEASDNLLLIAIIIGSSRTE